MNCSRCGAAEAVLKRDAAFYCGKCALARDWEEVIALVQEERVTLAKDAAPTIDFGSPNGGEPAGVGSSPAAAPAGTGSADLPADPFA